MSLHRRLLEGGRLRHFTAESHDSTSLPTGPGSPAASVAPVSGRDAVTPMPAAVGPASKRGSPLSIVVDDGTTLASPTESEAKAAAATGAKPLLSPVTAEVAASLAAAGFVSESDDSDGGDERHGRGTIELHRLAQQAAFAPPTAQLHVDSKEAPAPHPTVSPLSAGVAQALAEHGFITDDDDDDGAGVDTGGGRNRHPGAASGGEDAAVMQALAMSWSRSPRALDDLELVRNMTRKRFGSPGSTAMSRNPMAASPPKRKLRRAGTSVSSMDDFEFTDEEFEVQRQPLSWSLLSVLALAQGWVGFLWLMFGLYMAGTGADRSATVAVMAAVGLPVMALSFFSFVATRRLNIARGWLLVGLSLVLEIVAVVVIVAAGMTSQRPVFILIGGAHLFALAATGLAAAWLQYTRRRTFNERKADALMVHHMKRSQAKLQFGDRVKLTIMAKRVVRRMRAHKDNVRNTRAGELEAYRALDRPRRVLRFMLYTLLMLLILFFTYIDLIYGVKFDSTQQAAWMLSSFISFMADAFLFEPIVELFRATIGFMVAVKGRDVRSVVEETFRVDKLRKENEARVAEAVAASRPPSRGGLSVSRPPSRGGLSVSRPPSRGGLALHASSQLQGV